MAIWLNTDGYPDLILKKKRELKNWISSVIEKEGFTAGEINIVFVSDDKLLEINKDFLNHDYFTDVISFDYSEGVSVSGDIFISVERVLENSKQFNSSFSKELLRVMIHGILHFLKYNDKSHEEKAKMRKLEDEYLKNVKGLIISSD